MVPVRLPNTINTQLWSLFVSLIQTTQSHGNGSSHKCKQHTLMVPVYLQNENKTVTVRSPVVSKVQRKHTEGQCSFLIIKLIVHCRPLFLSKIEFKKTGKAIYRLYDCLGTNNKTHFIRLLFNNKAKNTNTNTKTNTNHKLFVSLSVCSPPPYMIQP